MSSHLFECRSFVKMLVTILRHTNRFKTQKKVQISYFCDVNESHEAGQQTKKINQQQQKQ